MTEFFCEAPVHPDGTTRHIGTGKRYIITLDVTTQNTDERLARRGPKGSPGGLRLCEVCARLYAKALEAGALTIEGMETFEPVEQGALL